MYVWSLNPHIFILTEISCILVVKDKMEQMKAYKVKRWKSQTQGFGGKLGSNFEGQKVFQSTVFCFHEALLTY